MDPPTRKYAIRSRLTEERRVEATELRAQGYTYAEIASELDIPCTTIKRFFCYASFRKREKSYELARYGLTEEDLATMTAKQEGKCAVCAQVASLVVDHCHSTGKVRGLLCNSCNMMVGNHTPELLQNGAEYIRKANAA